MSSFRILLAAGAVLLPLSAPMVGQAHDHQHHAMEMGQPLAGASVYNLAQIWTDQDGKAIPLASLRGRPVVLTMAYTSCKELCPMTVEAMRALERDWTQRSAAPVTFAFFSFDSARDTPARLKEYAAARGLDPAHWLLLHGDERAVRDLAAVLGISYRRDENGDYDHAYSISVLDAEGVLAAQQTGNGQRTDALLAKLSEVTGASH